MFFPFKYKIMMSFIVIELFFLSIIIIYNYNSIHKFTNDITTRDINSNTILFQELVKTPMMIYDLATLDNMTERFASLPNIDKVILKDNKGQLLSQYNENKKYDFEGKNYKKIILPIEDDGMILGHVEVVFDLEYIQNQINENTKGIIQIAIIEIILSFLASFIIGRRLTQNLIVLDDAVKNISVESGIINVNIKSNDEFEHLGNSFNNMQVKLKDEIIKNIEKEKQLVQQSRSAAMGDMMSAIIHQWKQPLSVISISNGNIDLALMLKEKVERKDIQKNLTNIKEQVNYMNITMNDFRNFFKPQALEEYNISSSIQDVINLVGKIYKSNNILINTDLQETIMTSGYQNELNQVIINILNNARDIIIETKCDKKDILIRSFKENNYAVITITDFAGGVPEDIIDTIFDPYVTTKSDDKGTGIGLDMSQTIIKKVNGKLTVKNVNSLIENINYKGAQFRIELVLV